MFDGLRALAATLVFIYHAWFLFHRPDCGFVECQPDNWLLASVWRGAVVNLGTQGVALFYVISGFLLYRQFLVRRQVGIRGSVGLKAYAVRRAARILPAYWTVMLVVGLTLEGSPMLHGSGLLQYLGFAQIYTQGGLWRNPVPATWTICVELSFYVFLPVWAITVEWLLARIRRGLRFELGLITFLALISFAWKIWIVRSTTLQTDFQPLLVALPASLDVFAAGMALAVLSVERSEISGWFSRLMWNPELSWLVAGAVYALMCWFAAFDGPLGSGWAPRSLVVAFLKIVVAVALVAPATHTGQIRGLVPAFLKARPTVWIGAVSYGLYLWHIPVLRWIHGLDGTAGHVPLLVVAVAGLVAYLATLAIAATSWHLLERPVIDFAKVSEGRGKADSVSQGRPAVAIDG
jgi:peptidoglycan/LPS O-acetylase OafA/YrhL